MIQPLFGQLFDRLGAADVHPRGSPVAYYEDAENDTIRVHAAVPVGAATTADVDILELPERAQAATIVHQGDMMEAERSMQTPARWTKDNGYRSQGYAREVTLQFDPDNPVNWVHEFQIQVTKPFAIPSRTDDGIGAASSCVMSRWLRLAEGVLDALLGAGGSCRWSGAMAPARPASAPERG